jgi:hypothetical protein
MMEYRVLFEKDPVPIAGVAEHRLNIVHGSGGQVVNKIDFIPIFKIGFRQMRSDESGTSGNQYFHEIFLSVFLIDALIRLG